MASRICCCTQVEMLAVTEQRYSRMNLVDSVLPAPDSPEITRLWNMEKKSYVWFDSGGKFYY